MKAIFVFALFVAGICATSARRSYVPDTPGRQDSRYNLVEQMVVDEIELIQQSIKDGGLDPFYVEKESFGYQLPVPELFNAAAYLENLLFAGLSNIVIKNMDYSFLWFRLLFELELPRLEVSARALNGDVSLFGNNLSVAADGRVDVRETVVSGRADVRLSISQGLHVSSVTVEFDLGRITSHIRLAIQGNNYSENINTFLGVTIPEVLEEFKDQVDELIGLIILDMLN